MAKIVRARTEQGMYRIDVLTDNGDTKTYYFSRDIPSGMTKLQYAQSIIKSLQDTLNFVAPAIQDDALPIEGQTI